MISDLLETLKGLEIALKTAWTAAIVGACGLLLSRFEVWPLAGDQQYTAPLFFILLLVGGTRLFVELGSFVVGEIRKLRARASDRKSAERTAADEEMQALKNLKTLKQHEMYQLAFILRAGNQRFDYPIEFSLVQKKIVVPVSIRSGWHLSDVADCVWNRREELLEKYKSLVPAQRKFPVVSPWV